MRRQAVLASLSGAVLVALLVSQNADVKALLPSSQAELTATDRQVEELRQSLNRDGSKTAVRVQLAETYLQKVSETGDASYYLKAEEVLKNAAEKDLENPEVLTTRAKVALGRHDFSQALELGTKALEINPNRAAYYGPVGDAQIELGRYEDAVKTYQAMVDKRPDANSLSRVAYIRELYGDIAGAEQALKSAITAGAARPEQTAAIQVELGNLLLRKDLDGAERVYKQALHTARDFVPALEGLGKVAYARNQYNQAQAYFEQSFAALPTAQHATNLGDLYLARGDKTKSSQYYALAQVAYDTAQKSGVNVQLERARFLADNDLNIPTAVDNARAAYSKHPSINSADALAWSLYKAGKYSEAQTYIQQALRLGEHDSLILFHAGLIAQKNNNPQEARRYLAKALEQNPNFGLLQPKLAAEALQQL